MKWMCPRDSQPLPVQTIPAALMDTSLMGDQWCYLPAPLLPHSGHLDQFHKLRGQCHELQGFQSNRPCTDLYWRPTIFSGQRVTIPSTAKSRNRLINSWHIHIVQVKDVYLIVNLQYSINLYSCWKTVA